jgi:hypothetical protein
MTDTNAAGALNLVSPSDGARAIFAELTAWRFGSWSTPTRTALTAATPRGRSRGLGEIGLDFAA